MKILKQEKDIIFANIVIGNLRESYIFQVGLIQLNLKYNCSFPPAYRIICKKIIDFWGYINEEILANNHGWWEGVINLTPYGLENMKEIILKLIELKRIRYEKKYCKHEWKLESETTITNTIYNTKQEGRYKLYICSKCGKIKNIDSIELF